MKKKNVGSFISGMLVMLLVVCLTGTALATTGKVTKELEYRDISVTLDGKKLNLKDAQGRPVEPFMFVGTNYLPVRALAESLGLEVAWDGKTNTVVLTTPKNSGSTSVREGMYLVGKDIPAGTYLLTATDDLGAYYARCSDASGEIEAIIANDNFDTTAYITVNEGEYLQLVRCSGALQ